MFKETPWGPAEKVLFGNRDYTFGMVWAENGHGLIIHESVANQRDKERGEKVGEYYFIDGVMRK